MYFPRIISRLDVKGPNLVKGIHLEGLRVLGDPAKFAEKYYNDGIDEIFYQDVVASLYNRNSISDLVLKTAEMISIPLTVGGGIRNINDIHKLLNSGADKVSINTASIKNPNLISDAVRIFGSSTIVVALEVIKDITGEYKIYTDNGREYTGINAFDWGKKVSLLGAGEILLTSIDRDGTGVGFDIDLVKEMQSIVSIPVIAHGGAATTSHIEEVFKKGKIQAVALASMLHYGNEKTFYDINYSNSEGNTSYLKNSISTKKFQVQSIEKIKKELSKKNIITRTI